MLNLSITRSQCSHQFLIPNYKPVFSGSEKPSFLAAPKFKLRENNNYVRVGQGSSMIKAVKSLTYKSTPTTTTTTTTITVEITVLHSVLKTIADLVLHLQETVEQEAVDYFADFIFASINIKLVAAQLDPQTKKEKTTSGGASASKQGSGSELKTSYVANIEIPKDFGDVGAILLENEHHREMFVENIVIDKDELLGSPIKVACNSWIRSKEQRIFFPDNKSYLPSETPSGLQSYREKELHNLRGDDPLLESRPQLVPYVPIDEVFSALKIVTFPIKLINGLIPQIKMTQSDNELGFPSFTAIDNLFNDGVKLPATEDTKKLRDWLPRLINDALDYILRFEKPDMFKRDSFSWLSDAEFARQTLAGLNPCCIQLVTEWPLKSKLDPKVYGPAESAITKELIEKEIGGSMTLEEALEQKKLFILDYHDLLLPYVNKVRELKGTTLYGSRTLFFLTSSGTLSPVAIELTRPPKDDKPQWRDVYQPSSEPTQLWLWRLAKAHVLAHDAGFHQLVSHWLRTHCCVEPYIIAMNRQLSAMHPIYRLLHPHFRYTMEINALARDALINADGTIERSFFPGKYSMEMSSVAYDQLWQFDLQALPGDLINRGMAVEDPTAPHGLKLTIEDYPFANDGLLIWDAIKKWVTDYVTYYYPEDQNLIQKDKELQAWWNEIQTVGHGDKRKASWWPELKTREDLMGILTNIIWVASGLHAAVNFGQYDFASYFPNRPTIARTNMPTEEDPNDNDGEVTEKFLNCPEKFLLACFPSKAQALTVMPVLHILSNHSPDEEYLGDKIQPYWEEDKHISDAFKRFSENIHNIEKTINARNADGELNNRIGAGVVPYQLLKPFSQPGVTGMGVPNSISI